MRKAAPQRILETDLYPPLRDFLTAQGYQVNSEVKHCDIVATRGDEVVIVEMKKSFNTTLLIQAVKRQKLTDNVYIAIPRPRESMRRRSWQDLCHLVRRLELGLLLVNLQHQPATVEVVLEPVAFDREKSIRRGRPKRSSLLKEVRDRHGDYNTGGSSRRKLMTAYKENSFQIACYLNLCGPLSPRKLQVLGTGKKTSTILQKNYYGWFERIAKGIYQITPSGQEFLQNYPELEAFYRGQLKMLNELPPANIN